MPMRCSIRAASSGCCGISRNAGDRARALFRTTASGWVEDAPGPAGGAAEEGVGSGLRLSTIDRPTVG